MLGFLKNDAIFTPPKTPLEKFCKPPQNLPQNLPQNPPRAADRGHPWFEINK